MPDRRPASALAAQIAGARAHPRPALLATASGLVNGATMVVGAGAIGWSTDHLVIPALAREPVAAGAWWTSALLVMGISALRWSTIFVRGLATGRVQYRAQAETRRAVVRRYLDLDLSWHRRRSPGQLLAHAVADVDALWQPMQYAYFAAGMVFMLLLALADLFLRDVVLGLVGLALVVLVLALNVIYQRLLAPRARAAQAARGVVGGIAHESIEGDPVVRSLSLTAVEDARFAPGVERLRTADLRMAAVSSVFDPMLELLPTVAVLAVLAAGAPRVAHGRLSVGDLVGVVYLLITIAIPLNVISRFLRIEPGEHIAVVGRTGSGKSTFAKLLTRRLEPAAGAIALSGIPLGRLAGASTAGRVVIVPQDPVSIAHRMITAASADRVLVFAAGRLVQSGHHSALVPEPGPYAGLVAAWHHHSPGGPS